MKKAAIVALSFLVGATSYSQPSNGSDAYVLSPIRVFAGSSLEESGAATSSFSTGALDLYQMQTVQETSALVPNLFVSSSETRGFGDTITMRGMGNTLFFSPAGVSLYVDDVPSGDVFTYSSELFSGNSLTVHRGAMGSFFGRNGPAGVIEIHSPRPTEDQQIELSAEFGDYDQRAFRINLSGALADSGLSHSLNLYHNEREGYMRNATLGRDTDSREAQGGQYNLFFSAGNGWNGRLKFVVEDINDGSQRLSSLFSPDPFIVASDLEGETQIERHQASLHLDRQFGWGQFKSITAVQDWEIDPSTVDLDLSPNPISTSEIEQDQDLLSQEFRFESSDEDQPVDWRAGLFYSEKETNGVSTRVFPAPPFFPVFTEETTFLFEETQIAAFGHVAYQASDIFVVDAGVRIQETETEIDRAKVSPIGLAPIMGDRSKTNYSADAGFRFDVSESFSLFGRVANSFKPKGFSAYTDIGSLAVFEDESAWSKEVGFEYATNDDVIRIRVTAFDIEIDDYQLERSVPMATDYIVINAQEVSSDGIEVEAIWKPIPEFELEAGFGTNDVTFDTHIDPFSNESLAGNTVPFTPEYTLRGSARYSFGGGLFAQATFRSIGETFFDETNAAMFSQGSYEVYDAQFGYRGEQFSIVAFGENLGDERYHTFINPQIFAATPGAPETYGVRLSWRY